MSPFLIIAAWYVTGLIATLLLQFVWWWEGEVDLCVDTQMLSLAWFGPFAAIVSIYAIIEWFFSKWSPRLFSRPFVIIKRRNLK